MSPAFIPETNNRIYWTLQLLSDFIGFAQTICQQLGNWILFRTSSKRENKISTISMHKYLIPVIMTSSQTKPIARPSGYMHPMLALHLAICLSLRLSHDNSCVFRGTTWSARNERVPCLKNNINYRVFPVWNFIETVLQKENTSFHAHNSQFSVLNTQEGKGCSFSFFGIVCNKKE